MWLRFFYGLSEGEISASEVMKSEGREVFIGCTKEYTIHLKGAKEESVFVVSGGLFIWIQGVDDTCIRKIDGYQGNTRKPECVSASNTNIMFLNK